VTSDPIPATCEASSENMDMSIRWCAAHQRPIESCLLETRTRERDSALRERDEAVAKNEEICVMFERALEFANHGHDPSERRAGYRHDDCEGWEIHEFLNSARHFLISLKSARDEKAGSGEGEDALHQPNRDTVTTERIGTSNRLIRTPASNTRADAKTEGGA
jgi:hypothetical protein